MSSCDNKTSYKVVKIEQLKESYAFIFINPYEFNALCLYSKEGKCPPKDTPVPLAKFMWIWGLNFKSNVPERDVI